MKLKKELETTTNSSVYTKIRYNYLGNIHGFCSRCRPNRGCNSKASRWKNHFSWKLHRKTQYRNGNS